jgi:Uncharacterized protein conserved in bacteria
MDTDRDDHAPSSPWRQPVVWLVVALVAAAVAGGVTMVIVAGGAGDNDAVPDQVQRTAGAQVADIDADELARQRRLSAIVRIDAKRGIVQVLPVSGDFDRTRPLLLSLHHPVREAEDRVLDLAASGPGWQAAARIDGSHDWNLLLAPQDASPEDGKWRLRGRLPRGQLAARVAPSLQEQ